MIFQLLHSIPKIFKLFFKNFNKYRKIEYIAEFRVLKIDNNSLSYDSSQIVNMYCINNIIDKILN